MRRWLSVIANDSLLLLTAVIWGVAFVAQRAGMEHVGPFTYNAVRFSIGSLTLVPILLLRRGRAGSPRPVGAGRAGPGVWTGGLLAGVILFLGASLQQAGLVSTTAGKGGFITGLYVVLVPLTGLFRRQRAGWGGWVGATLSLAGLFLLSVSDRFTMERGDLLVLASALFWTAHVQIVGWLSPRMNPLGLACLQFAVCAVLCAAGAALTETVLLSGILRAAVPILYGGLLSVGVAFTLQVVAQAKAPPTHAAVILSLESVFAALGGALILSERLGTRGAVGCVIMFAGMLFSQVPRLLRASGPGAPTRSRHGRSPLAPPGVAR